jgi:hypothetical protein
MYLGSNLASLVDHLFVPLQASPGRRHRLNLALDGPLVVDVALARKPSVARNERVAIQLETPDMFAANPPHAALGPTAARWRALQSRGWQVGCMWLMGITQLHTSCGMAT